MAVNIQLRLHQCEKVEANAQIPESVDGFDSRTCAH